MPATFEDAQYLLDRAIEALSQEWKIPSNIRGLVLDLIVQAQQALTQAVDNLD